MSASACGGRGFTFDDAFELLSDLEVTMPPRNPGCIPELRRFLGDAPLSELQQTVHHAASDSRPRHRCRGLLTTLSHSLLTGSRSTRRCRSRKP